MHFTSLNASYTADIILCLVIVDAAAILRRDHTESEVETMKAAAHQPRLLIKYHKRREEITVFIFLAHI